jgi:hypothetical protein
MSTSRAARAVLLLIICGLASAAALVNTPSATSTAGPLGSMGGTSPMSVVAGTVGTRLVFDRFRAVGRKVVGQGTAVSTWRSADGRTTVKRKHFSLTIRGSKRHTQQAQTVCPILDLTLGELDLTLAGLHVTLLPADPSQPIHLQLTADDTHGVLGRLFCQLANGRGVLGTKLRAHRVARRLNKYLHLRHTTVMRVRATIYAPSGAAGRATGRSTGQGALHSPLVDECPVLHLVLGPLHLDLLGLVVDLNQVILDIKAIPGTLLGDIFCQLLTPPPPPPPAPARIG